MKPIDRFWIRVKKTKTCWLWTGGKDPKGYGLFYVNKRQVKATRWIYQIVNKTILSKDMCVCHTCDNPTCVNPSHLWQGTIAQNNIDRSNKNRNYQGIKHWNTKLTEKQVLEIFNSNMKQVDLAKKFSVNISTIYDIRNKRIWKHLTNKT